MRFKISVKAKKKKNKRKKILKAKPINLLFRGGPIKCVDTVIRQFDMNTSFTSLSHKLMTIRALCVSIRDWKLVTCYSILCVYVSLYAGYSFKKKFTSSSTNMQKQTRGSSCMLLNWIECCVYVFNQIRLHHIFLYTITPHININELNETSKENNMLALCLSQLSIYPECVCMCSVKPNTVKKSAENVRLDKLVQEEKNSKSIYILSNPKIWKLFDEQELI